MKTLSYSTKSMRSLTDNKMKDELQKLGPRKNRIQSITRSSCELPDGQRKKKSLGIILQGLQIYNQIQRTIQKPHANVFQCMGTYSRPTDQCYTNTSFTHGSSSTTSCCPSAKAPPLSRRNVPTDNISA